MVCCFFGHKDIPNDVAETLRPVLENLICEGVDTFLVGHQGDFDRIALGTLRRLKREFPHICYFVVLAYMPGEKAEFLAYAPGETLYPEGLETVHPRYAISWRNRWMLRQADVVVSYVSHTWGGAAACVKQAVKRNQRVINIAQAEN